MFPHKSMRWQEKRRRNLPQQKTPAGSPAGVMAHPSISSMSVKGTINGLTGFKYGLLRDRGEALLIASGYAEVHSF